MTFFTIFSTMRINILKIKTNLLRIPQSLNMAVDVHALYVYAYIHGYLRQENNHYIMFKSMYITYVLMKHLSF
jgi:hypothetical protein